MYLQDILGGENLIFPYGYYAGYGIGFGAPYLLPTYIGDCSFDCSAADFSAGNWSIELSMGLREVSQCLEKAPTRAFSLLKVPTGTLTIAGEPKTASLA